MLRRGSKGWEPEERRQQKGRDLVPCFLEKRWCLPPPGGGGPHRRRELLVASSEFRSSIRGLSFFFRGVTGFPEPKMELLLLQIV